MSGIYPDARITVNGTLTGVTFRDPYRWLEQNSSAEVANRSGQRRAAGAK